MQLNNFLLMLIPALVAVTGGIVAAFWNPDRNIRSLIQHFAAGVVLAALCVEVFPEISREHAPGWILAGSFLLGTLFMYTLKLWTIRIEHQYKYRSNNSEGLPLGLLLATYVDVSVDGMIIGAGFAAGGETGLILAIGLAVELLFLGLALSSDTIKGWRIAVISGGLGIVVLLFAVMGNILLTDASPLIISGALSFGGAALLYLVTEELLIEAHEVPEKPISTLVLFGGFLIFWCIQLLAI